ncbi:STAS domain-containing protein [Streptomyces sp. NPDC057403]|uniref:STAS domain-containing protein n=1 Tax=Streptomyces sp. NPDC057403 TaxID=3346119 RepID=UPI0036C94179
MTSTEHPQQTGRLSVTATTTDGVRVLTLAGEIDHHTGDTLRQALDSPGAPCPRIVVDMGEVTFMDSSGINILITVHQDLASTDGWLRLVAVGPSVMRTLSIVGLDAVIECHPTLRQALDA